MEAPRRERKDEDEWSAGVGVLEGCCEEGIVRRMVVGVRDVVRAGMRWLGGRGKLLMAGVLGGSVAAACRGDVVGSCRIGFFDGNIGLKDAITRSISSFISSSRESVARKATGGRLVAGTAGRYGR